MVKLVWKVRIFAKNFVSDFFTKLKNVVGGRLKAYENMLNQAIEETNKEFFNDFPDAKNIKVDTESFEGNAIMVTITGEIEEAT